MNRTTDRPALVSVTLPLDRDTFCASRAHAAGVLRAAALPSRIIDDVTVAVGELVTASYLAGASQVELAVEVGAHEVTAVVRDVRGPSGSTRVPAADPVREALLDAVTTTRSVVVEASGIMTVAGFRLSAE